MAALATDGSQATAQDAWFGPVGLQQWAAKARVSVGFAAADLTSPMSTFGHPFLVAHDEHPPEPDAVVFEVFGDTTSHPAPYAAALFTSIEGRSRLRHFLYKAREYDLEDRDLWLYPVVINQEERRRLDTNMAHRLQAPHRYTFARLNCALVVHEILSESSRERCLETFGTYPIVQPVAVLQHHFQCGTLDLPTYHPSTARSAERSAFAAMAHRLPREPDPNVRDGLFESLKTTPLQEPPLSAPTPPQEVRTSTVLVGGSTKGRARLLLRPLQRTFFNAPRDGLGASYLEICSIDISAHGGKARLEDATVLRLDIQKPATTIASQLTRFVEATVAPDLAFRFGTGATAGTKVFSISGAPFVGVIDQADHGHEVTADLGLRVAAVAGAEGTPRARVVYMGHALRTTRRQRLTLEAVAFEGHGVLFASFATGTWVARHDLQREAGALVGYSF